MGQDHNATFCRGGSAFDVSWSEDGSNLYQDTAPLGLRTILQVAQEFGLTLRALRFYEAKGLLAPQREGPARGYDRRQRDRIAAIVKAKKLGFTLTEIRQMLGAPDDPADGHSLE